MQTDSRIRNLKYYIVKSCAGKEVQEAHVEKSGLSVGNYKDHEFALVDAQPDSDGAHLFVSQRGRKFKNDKPLPQMALISTVNDGEGMKLAYNGHSIGLPYDRNKGRELTVRIFEDVCPGAVDQGDELAEWFEEITGFPVRLVKASGNFSRRARQNYMQSDNPLRFQDGYPVHWFPIESVQELSQKSGEDISWQKFRPQIVAEGMPPQYEHQVLMGYAGEVQFKNAKPCERCRIPLIDQGTGKINKREPSYTLTKYKTWINIYGKGVVIFGENMLPLSEGTIRVGDPVRIVSRRQPSLVYGAKPS